MLELLFKRPRLASLRVFTPTVRCELLSLEGRADVMLPLALQSRLCSPSSLIILSKTREWLMDISSTKPSPSQGHTPGHTPDTQHNHPPPKRAESESVGVVQDKQGKWVADAGKDSTTSHPSHSGAAPFARVGPFVAPSCPVRGLWGLAVSIRKSGGLNWSVCLEQTVRVALVQKNTPRIPIE